MKKSLTPHFYHFTTSQKLTDQQIDLINFFITDHLFTHESTDLDDIPELTTELEYSILQ